MQPLTRPGLCLTDGREPLPLTGPFHEYDNVHVFFTCTGQDFADQNQSQNYAVNKRFRNTT